MIKIKTVFAVIDPTRESQRALDRAIHIARIARARVHVYVCIHTDLETEDTDALAMAETARYQLWVDRIIKQLDVEDLEVTSQIEWNKNWREAIAAAAREVNSDLIVKPSRSHSASERLFINSSDLALFNQAMCPILLIKSDQPISSHTVLIAIDAKREDKKYNTIKEKIIDFGKAVAAAYDDGELYAVHAYTSQDDYVHVTDLARVARLDSKNVRVVGEEPEQAIAKIAAEVNAQLVIIGLSTKSTLVNRVFGSTGEWLLNNLSQDLMVIFPEE